MKSPNGFNWFRPNVKNFVAIVYLQFDFFLGETVRQKYFCVLKHN